MYDDCCLNSKVVARDQINSTNINSADSLILALLITNQINSELS
jgi:hypothetical protein